MEKVRLLLGDGGGSGDSLGPEWEMSFLLSLPLPGPSLQARRCWGLSVQAQSSAPGFGEEARGNPGLLAKVATGQAASVLTFPGLYYSG